MPTLDEIKQSQHILLIKFCYRLQTLKQWHDHTLAEIYNIHRSALSTINRFTINTGEHTQPAIKSTTTSLSSHSNDRQLTFLTEYYRSQLNELLDQVSECRLLRCQQVAAVRALFRGLFYLIPIEQISPHFRLERSAWPASASASEV